MTTTTSDAALLRSGYDAFAALVTEKAERNGAHLDVPAVHVWTIQDGKAATFQAFQHDDHVLDEFWS